MPQGSPPPILDYGRPPRGARLRRITEWAVGISAAAILLLLQPRVISLVLLAVLLAARALAGVLSGSRDNASGSAGKARGGSRGLAMLRGKRYPIVVVLLVAASLFLPFDVALGSVYFGHRYGTRPGGARGPHFVRFVVGMPRHALLKKTYGEYINCGCVSPAAIPPEWVWVWD